MDTRNTATNFWATAIVTFYSGALLCVLQCFVEMTMDGVGNGIYSLKAIFVGCGVALFKDDLI